MREDSNSDLATNTKLGGVRGLCSRFRCGCRGSRAREKKSGSRAAALHITSVYYKYRVHFKNSGSSDGSQERHLGLATRAGTSAARGGCLHCYGGNAQPGALLSRCGALDLLDQIVAGAREQIRMGIAGLGGVLESLPLCGGVSSTGHAAVIGAASAFDNREGNQFERRELPAEWFGFNIGIRC
jgi:hypothetical protein